MSKRTLVLAAVLAVASVAADDRGPAFRLNGKIDGKTDVTLDVLGLDKTTLDRLSAAKFDAAGWADVLSLTVNGKPPAVAGSWRVTDGVLRFEPRFPLSLGVRYRAAFDPSKLPGASGGKPIVEELFVPKPPPKSTTSLVQLYPTRDRLPENQLKFYLHFSAPMSRGEVYKRVRLLNDKGKAIELPFLELDEELWDETGKRLTLFFNPGRIKRGLKPREEFGPILEDGKSYTFVVERDWPDAEGNLLTAEVRKSFRAGPPDDVQPDVENWKLQPPDANTDKALTVTFPDPLDHAMLLRVVRVTTADGKPVAGKVEVSEGETRWQFRPEKPWAAGEYHLVADTTLEDLAGNSIARPFEVDVFRPVQKRIEVKTVKVPFRVGR